MIAPSQVVAVTEDPQPGQMILSKTAESANDSENPRDYDVTLAIQGSEITTQAPVDVVLVLDTSGSMDDKTDVVDHYNWWGWPVYKTRLKVAQEAAIEFAAQVISDNTNSKVAVVTYSGDDGKGDRPYDDSSTVTGFTRNNSTISSEINKLKADGGTNIEAGFYQAGLVLNEARPTSERVVVLMTDGMPTYRYASNGYTDGNGKNYSIDNKTHAISAAFRVKKDYDAKIYTVGFTASSEMTTNIRAVLDPTGENKYHEAYYEASNAASLTTAFAEISNKMSAAANDAIVVDTINDDFEFVEFADSVGNNVTRDGQTITWTIGDVDNELMSITFRVRAKNPLYGAAYTNDEAVLYFNSSAVNDFYDDAQYNTPNSSDITDREKCLTFNKPVVEVSPIAVDDTYNVVAGETVNLDSVLNNDLSTQVHNATADGWTTTRRTAVMLSDSFSGDGNVESFNGDGTFKFKSEDTASGTSTFRYEIQTTVTKDEYTNTLVDEATVTIRIEQKYPVTVEYYYRGNDTAFDTEGLGYYKVDSSVAITDIPEPTHADLVPTKLVISSTDTTTMPYTVQASNDNLIKVYYESVPVALNDTAKLLRDADTGLTPNIDINVLANDTDHWGDTLTIESIVTAPLTGTVVIDNGIIKYTPNIDKPEDNYVDADGDSFTYRITDGQGQTATATVTIFTPPNYPLTLNKVDIDTKEMIDTDNNPESIIIPMGESHTVVGADYLITGYEFLGLMPNQEANEDSNANRVAVMSLPSLPTVIDEDSLEDSATIEMIEDGITLNLLYRKGVFGYKVEYYYARNTEEPFATWVSDAQFESIVDSWPLPTDTAAGVVYSDTEAELINLDNFEAPTTDGSPLTITADPEENVIRVYYAAIPTAEDDSVTTPMNESVTIDVLANDSDPLDGALIVVDVEDPDDAEVTINENGTITVTPDEGFTGTIVFDYTVINEEERSATATVTVTVEAPAPTPTPIPTIEVVETTPPLAEPTTAAPLPTIKTTQESVPLAQPTIKVEPQEIPQSGENTPVWPIGLALLLIAGGLTYILHSKEEKAQ